MFFGGKVVWGRPPCPLCSRKPAFAVNFHSVAVNFHSVAVNFHSVAVNFHSFVVNFHSVAVKDT